MVCGSLLMWVPLGLSRPRECNLLRFAHSKPTSSVTQEFVCVCIQLSLHWMCVMARNHDLNWCAVYSECVSVTSLSHQAIGLERKEGRSA